MLSVASEAIVRDVCSVHETQKYQTKTKTSIPRPRRDLLVVETRPRPWSRLVTGRCRFWVDVGRIHVSVFKSVFFEVGSAFGIGVSKYCFDFSRDLAISWHVRETQRSETETFVGLETVSRPRRRRPRPYPWQLLCEGVCFLILFCLLAQNIYASFLWC